MLYPISKHYNLYMVKLEYNIKLRFNTKTSVYNMILEQSDQCRITCKNIKCGILFCFDQIYSMISTEKLKFWKKAKHLI